MSEWYSVKKRLPEKGHAVIVTSNFYNYAIADRDELGWYLEIGMLNPINNEYCEINDNLVTHWKEIN